MCINQSQSVTHFNNVMIERPEKARIPCFLGRGPNKRKALKTLVERTEISINSSHIGTSWDNLTTDLVAGWTGRYFTPRTSTSSPFCSRTGSTYTVLFC